MSNHVVTHYRSLASRLLVDEYGSHGEPEPEALRQAVAARLRQRRDEDDTLYLLLRGAPYEAVIAELKDVSVVRLDPEGSYSVWAVHWPESDAGDDEVFLRTYKPADRYTEVEMHLNLPADCLRDLPQELGLNGE